MINNNTEENRSKLHCVNVEYITHLKAEESIFKQKTQLHWFKEGDANSKYFHAPMRGRRRRLFIHKIYTKNVDWIQGDVDIANAAYEHFNSIFSGKEQSIIEDMLQCIPRMVTPDKN